MYFISNVLRSAFSNAYIFSYLTFYLITMAEEECARKTFSKIKEIKISLVK